MPTLEERCATFRQLHAGGCFVIPNPWDVGTARYLEHLGFRALATTSAGFAFSQGLPDADWAVPRDSMLAHIAEMAAATDLPVNADFESGYAHEPETVAANVRLCAAAGVAGLSIEDASGRKEEPLYDLSLAVDRIKAARAVLDEAAPGVLLTARAECFLVGHPAAFEESLRRLQAYAQAGADVLYAPGLFKPEQIRAIVSAVAPKPVNLLIGWSGGLTVSQAADLGVRRISVGSSLARIAWTGFIRAARQIAEGGNFEGFEGVVPYHELNALFRQPVN
jgi:2-methylisocitrate lyase-like PEP mutase family enzyme